MLLLSLYLLLALLTTVSKFGHFRSLHDASVNSCINEYLAIDSGENVSDLVLARNCSNARMLPMMCRNEQVSQGRERVNHFEQSNGLDTATYKQHTFTFESIHFIIPLRIKPIIRFGCSICKFVVVVFCIYHIAYFSTT